VKAKKVKPVKVQVQQTQQTRQAPYQNTDFKFATTVNQTGVLILTNFHGNLVHKFLLPHTDYALWVGLNPQQKYNYTQVRVHSNAFWYDMQLVHAEAHRIQVQQAQRRM
jgi:hypothetical protein